VKLRFNDMIGRDVLESRHSAHRSRLHRYPKKESEQLVFSTHMYTRGLNTGASKNDLTEKVSARRPKD
jgi:hypothetical protein